MARASSLVVATASLLVLLTSAAQAVEYRIIDLGNLRGFEYGEATDVNDAGLIVGGCSLTGSGELWRACYWDNNGIHELEMPGGEGKAWGVNNQGAIVGWSSGPGGIDRFGYLWDDEGAHTLQPLAGWKDAVARDITESGLIVGWASQDGSLQACQWTDGAVRKLPKLPGRLSSGVTGANDAGQMVGWSYGEPFGMYPCVWDSDGIHTLPLLAGRGGHAEAINDIGQIVGYEYVEGSHHHATLWDKSGPHDLGTPGGGQDSIAEDINEAGLIVGWSDSSSRRAAPYYWDAEGAHALPLLAEGRDGKAWAVNKNGVIVGFAFADRDHAHACMWVLVPEPAGPLALLCAVGTLIAGARSRRRKQ